jgi:hypothetical protein
MHFVDRGPVWGAQVLECVPQRGQNALAEKFCVVEFVDDDVGSPCRLQVALLHFCRGLVDKADRRLHAIGTQTARRTPGHRSKALAGRHVRCS